MPSLSNLASAGLEIGGNIWDYANRRKTAGNVTNTITGGNDAAAATIRQNSTTLSALNQDVLAQQRKTNAPYLATGERSLADLEAGVKPGGGLADPYKGFMATDLDNDPGYKFRLAEGQKILNRSANANLNRFSGGTLKALDRFNQDYASQEFGVAAARDEKTFRDNQNTRYKALSDLAGIGETAAGRENTSLSDFGNRETANQVLTSQQIADLQQQKAQAVAEGDVAKANSLSDLIDGGINTGLELLNSAAGGVDAGTKAAAAWNSATVGAPATAGTLAALAAPAGVALPSAAAASTLATAAGGAAVGVGGGTAAALPAPALASASAGGFGSTMAALATNPITIGIAGVLAVGAMWLKSQAKWEANTAVKEFENPFAEKSIYPFAKQWDEAMASGAMTPEAGAQAREQYVKNYYDYISRIQEWAGNSSDRKTVARQSILNLWNTAVRDQISRIDGGLAQLGAA